MDKKIYLGKIKKIIIPILLISIFTLGIFLRIHHLKTVVTRTPDENTYTYQARVIASEGPEGIKLLLHEHRNNKKLWVYPPPIRIGYLLPLAALMNMLNNEDVIVGSYVSCLFSIITMLILVILGWRFFNQWIMLFALLFLSVSPMDLMIARRTWQDAILGCLGLFLIYITCEIRRNANKFFWYALFILTGSLIMLIKESGAVIYGLCTFWIFCILLYKEKAILKAFLLGAFSVLSIVASITVLSHFTGGFSNVLEVLRHLKEGLPTNAYAIESQTGPWYYLPGSFWIISPLNAILCVTGVVAALIFNKQNRDTVLAIIIFSAILIFITVAIPHLQNLRYVSVLFAPFYLIAGLGLWHILMLLKGRLSNSAFLLLSFGIVILLSVTAMQDYERFQKKFVSTQLRDMSIRLLRAVHHI